MLLACYSHKHISYRIRTIIRKAITQKYIEEALEKKMFIELESEKTSECSSILSDVEVSSNDGEELAI